MGKPDAKSIWTTGIVAAVVAAVINAALAVIGTQVFGLNASGAFQPLQGPGPAIIFTLFFLLIATLVFQVVANRSDRPVAQFRTIAIVALALSLIPDFLMVSQPGGGWGEAILLMVMHVVAAAVIYGAFARKFA